MQQTNKPRPQQNWKLTLEYDGSKYSGWQEQQNARSVAGELRLAAEKVFGQPIELYGAGRTDAGVHARGQVANLRLGTKSNKSAAKLLAELNDKLPASIAVLDLSPASLDFHARHSAKSRTYVYQIATRKSAFTKNYVWWVKEPLNVTAMRVAAAHFAGRHNFRNFQALDAQKEKESPIVVVESASVEERGSGRLDIEITASHFLWRMVRRMVGVLVQVGLGQYSADGIPDLYKQQPPGLDIAAHTAPAAGLFLEKVSY